MTSNGLLDGSLPAHGQGQDAPVSTDLTKNINLGSRSSKLALVQANQASSLLSAAHPGLSFPITTVMVRGDDDKTTPFLLMASKTGGGSDAAKNLWTEEMETQLCAGDLDILVHSLKDMPMLLPPGCMLGAIVERQDSSDALLVKPGLPYTSLDQLPAGSIVGTSSTRRKALLKRKHPHLTVQECRGNIDTRLRKLDAEDSPFTCIILATAGLNRMNLQDRITQRLPPTEFPYAVGQGALGIEIRTGDERILQLLQLIEHKESRWMCLAERAMLRKLQGGCSSPVGVMCFIDEKKVEVDEKVVGVEKVLTLHGSVIHPHGWSEVSSDGSATVTSDADAEALGLEVAEKLLKSGAYELLEQIRQIGNAGFEKHMEQQFDEEHPDGARPHLHAS